MPDPKKPQPRTKAGTTSTGTKGTRPATDKEVQAGDKAKAKTKGKGKKSQQ